MADKSKTAMTLRVGTTQHEELELAAKANGTSVSDEVRQAIAERIGKLRQDPEFQARLKASLERNREILEGLGST